LTFLTAYKVRTEKRSCTLKTEYQIIRYFPAAGKPMPATSAVRRDPHTRGAINAG
jgi:hypothetical protein